MSRGRFVVEFRSGSFFKGPRPERGGTLAQAMRFNQEKHAAQYLDHRAPWAWMNGALVTTVESREAIERRVSAFFSARAASRRP